MILALLAVQVAARSCDRKNRRSGEKMKKGLLFNRIHIQRAGMGVGCTADRSVNVGTHPAVPKFAGSKLTPFRADRAFTRCFHRPSDRQTASPTLQTRRIRPA